MFTLKQKESGSECMRFKKFINKKDKVTTMIYGDGNIFYRFGNDSINGMCIRSIGSNNSYIKGISRIFKETKDGNEIIGINCNDNDVVFTVNRLFVLEMK